MKLRFLAVWMATLCATFFITGCAVPTKTTTLNQSEVALWRGRLALRVESDRAQSEPRLLSAGFELSGNAAAGALTLYTPLGSTVAALSWSSQAVSMQTNGDILYFDSLDALIKEALGTEIPVAALFAWLAGNNMAVTGWSVDLSQHASGRITARRTEPAPPAELRLVLD